MKPRSNLSAPLTVGAVSAVLLLTLLAYRPVFSAGFIWDDDAHITPPALRTAEGLGRIWTEPGATQQYYPLLHSAFWLQHRLWGDTPGGYHATNLLLHLLGVLLFWRLLRALAVPGAGLAAALFALHPVQVETVAWVSEQKNTLSAALALGAAWSWVRFDDHRRSGAWWLGFTLFLAALASKTAVAPLPAALLVVAWWRRGTLDLRQDVAPLLPWLVVAVGAGLFTASVERHLVGATGAEFDPTAIERLLQAGRTPWFYLAQLAWPRDLIFVYPRAPLLPAEPSAWAGLMLTLGLTAVLVACRRQRRDLLVVWLLFLGLLFPVLGLFAAYPFQYSFVADHFGYLASLPVCAGIAGLLAASGRWRKPLMVAFVLLVLPALAIRTERHARNFRDAATLYRHTTERNPGAWMAWNNLGRELLGDPARRPEAVACFERALALRPDYYEARTNLGLALTQSGRAPDALPHLHRAVELEPAAYQVHTNLGIALVSAGRAPEALIAFRTAAALAPRLPNARENLAKALLLAGHREAAAAEFAVAARLRQTAAFAVSDK